MKSLRESNEDILTYAERISDLYLEKYPLDLRKKKARFSHHPLLVNLW